MSDALVEQLGEIEAGRRNSVRAIARESRTRSSAMPSWMWMR